MADVPQSGPPSPSDGDAAPPPPRKPLPVSFVNDLPGRPGPAEEEILETIAGPGAEDRYDEGPEIARGGMGAIVELFDRDIGRPVAMKVVLEGGDGARVARFVEEAQLTGRLEHPNIVPVYEIGVNPHGKAYFTMKRVHGQSLQDILAKIGEGDGDMSDRFPLSALLRVFLKICDAVGFAHSRGVLHRDLKPENVMVGAFGEVLVMDWGLAKQIRAGAPDRAHRQGPALPGGDPRVPGGQDTDPGNPVRSRTLDGEVIGTPSTMAPEQATGRVEAIDERTDVFALGAILYAILCQDAPYGGADVMEVLKKAAEGAFTPPGRRASARPVPAELEAVCLRCMARAREDRYGSVEAVSRDVQAFLDRRLVSAYRYGPGERLLRWIQRHPAASVGLGVGGVLLAVGATVTSILVQQAEIARIRAVRAEGARAVAEEKAETALSNLEKGRRTSALLRAARQDLGPVYEDLVGCRHSQRDDAARRAALARHRARLDAFGAVVAEDSASQAAWLALQGWFSWLGGAKEEAEGFFAASRERDPDVAYGSLFDGMRWLSQIIEGQPMPQVLYGPGGVRAYNVVTESPEAREGRAKFEAALAEVRRAGVWGETSAQEYEEVLAGFRGILEGDYERADIGLSRALSLAEMAFLNVDLLIARARVRHYRKAFAEGLRDLDAVVRLCPDSVVSHFFRGELLLGRGLQEVENKEDPRASFTDAGEAYTAAVRLEPASPYGYNGRATARLFLFTYARARDDDLGSGFEKIVQDYTAALDLSGPYPNILGNRAAAYRALAELERERGRDPRPWLRRAEADLREGLARAPDVWTLHNTLGKVFGEMGEAFLPDWDAAAPWFEKAVASLETARRILPDDPHPLTALSLVHRFHGDAKARRGEDPREDYRKAVAACEEALRQGDRSGQILNNLGGALANLARAELLNGNDGMPLYEKALEVLAESSRREPDIRFPHSNRALILTRLGRFEEAAEAIRDLLALPGPPNPRNLENTQEVVALALGSKPWVRAALAGHQFFNQGAYGRARAEYEKSLQLLEGSGAPFEGRENELAAAAQLRLAAVAAAAAQGKRAPLAPPSPVEPEEKRRLVEEAVKRLRACMDLHPPLLGQIRRNDDFRVLADNPDFVALMKAWEGK